VQAQDLQDSNLQLHARLRACEAKELQARRELAEVRAVMNRQARENEALRSDMNTLSRAITLGSLLPHYGRNVSASQQMQAEQEHPVL
jgi:hypothetical protein